MKSSPGKECWKTIGTGGTGTCERLAEFAHCGNCPVYFQWGRTLLDQATPDDYRDEWTQVLALEKEVQPTDTTSVLVFRCAGEWMALKTMCLAKVAAPRMIHTIPHRTNAVIAGLVNIEGELLLCASLPNLLQLESENSAPAPEADKNRKVFHRMLVIGDAEGRWVLPVDEVHVMYRLPASEIQKPPVTVAKAAAIFSTGLFNLSGKQVALLDEQLVLNSLKRSFQ